MTAGPFSLHQPAGLGGQAHLVQTEKSLAWDRLQRAVQDGPAAEIRSALDHLIGVSR
jgi:hypothetical protein